MAASMPQVAQFMTIPEVIMSSGAPTGWEGRGSAWRKGTPADARSCDRRPCPIVQENVPSSPFVFLSRTVPGISTIEPSLGSRTLSGAGHATRGLGRVAATANRQGEFRVPVLIFVRDDVLGLRHLTADDVGDPGSLPARAQFLVVPARLQPPGFVGRR